MRNKERPLLAISSRMAAPPDVPSSPTSTLSTLSSAETSPRTPDDNISLPFRTSPSKARAFSAKWNAEQNQLSYSDTPGAPRLKGPPKLTSLAPSLSRRKEEPPTDAIAPSTPFALLGSRNPYFIGLPSPGAYDQFIQGPGEDVSRLRVKRIASENAKKQPPFAPAKPRLGERGRMMSADAVQPRPRPPLPKRYETMPAAPTRKEPDTPHSTLTFAAVWDPREGISTFRGRMRLDDSSKQFSSSPSKAVPTLNLAHLNNPLIVDQLTNEHLDCEPHLPSRFSTTTTSTSDYINVDFDDISDSYYDDDYHHPWEDDSIPTQPSHPPLNSGKSMISPPFLQQSPPRSSTPRPEPTQTQSPSTLFSPLMRSKSSPVKPRRPIQSPGSTPPGALSPSGTISSGKSSLSPKRPGLFGKFKSTGRKGSVQREAEGWVSVELL